MAKFQANITLSEKERHGKKSSNTNWEAELYKREFSESELSEIIGKVDVLTVLKTQVLSIGFICKQIIDVDPSSLSVEERDIGISEITKYQGYDESDIRNHLNRSDK